MFNASVQLIPYNNLFIKIFQPLQFIKIHFLILATKVHKENNKKLLRGVQGGGFLEKSPPGRRRHIDND
jgi:hypothetical protein